MYINKATQRKLIEKTASSQSAGFDCFVSFLSKPKWSVQFIRFVVRFIHAASAFLNIIIFFLFPHVKLD